MPVITVLYAGLLGLLSIAIAFSAGNARRASGVSIGDGGNQALILAMRRQANFVEVVPLVLILIALIELNGVRTAVIHALGGTLFLARALHAWGFRAEDSPHPGRAAGAVLSLLVTLVASCWAIWIFVARI